MAELQRESPSTASDPLLSSSEAARFLKVSERTLARWRVTGDGPAFVRVGPRRVAYHASVCSNYTAARTFAHRADEISRRTPALQPEAA